MEAKENTLTDLFPVFDALPTRERYPIYGIHEEGWKRYRVSVQVRIKNPAGSPCPSRLEGPPKNLDLTFPSEKAAEPFLEAINLRVGQAIGVCQ